MHDDQHQTGRTTRQLLDSPHGAVFVAPSYIAIRYCRDIAKSIGRDDIQIKDLTWLKNRSWRGRRYSAIILDHHTRSVLTRDQRLSFIESLDRAVRHAS